jgi:hypothetical protein
MPNSNADEFRGRNVFQSRGPGVYAEVVNFVLYALPILLL